MTEPLFRNPTPRDQGYVASTWFKQMQMVDRDYSRGGRWGQAGQHIDVVTARPGTRVLICHYPSDIERIRAWMVFELPPGPPVLHFVFVRKEDRQQGVATALLACAGINRDTQFVWTSVGPQSGVMKTKYPHGVHMPLARFLGVSAVP